MKRLRIALLLSFLVYLLPIIHPRGGNILGPFLWAKLANGLGGAEPMWLAMEVGLALALQAAAFVLFAWILGGGWRWLLLVPAIPAALWLLYVGYLIEIPNRFLLATDPPPETGDWPVACEIMGAATANPETGISLALERAGEIWINMEKRGYGLLTAEDCVVGWREKILSGGRGRIRYATGGGTVHYRLKLEGYGNFEHWYDGAGALAPVKLTVPGGTDDWQPVIDTDGGAMAWLETRRNADGSTDTHLIAIREMSTGEERRIELALGDNPSPKLLDFSLAEGVFQILRNHRELLRVGLDGAAMGAPLHPDGFDGNSQNYRLLDGGWVVWDAGWRDPQAGRYRVAWSLPAGKGLYEIPKGRSIGSLSVDPDGRYIAVATSSNLYAGRPDAVFVLRTADGVEIYRRYLTRQTRSHVGFLGPDRLAMTVGDDDRRRVRMLVVPRQEFPSP